MLVLLKCKVDLINFRTVGDGGSCFLWTYKGNIQGGLITLLSLSLSANIRLAIIAIGKKTTDTFNFMLSQKIALV